MRNISWLTVVAFWVIGTAGVASAGYTPCGAGRFTVDGAPLFASGAAGSDTVSFDAAGVVTIASACGPITGAVRAGRSGTMVRAKWIQCPAVGGVRLRMRIDAATCQAVIGRLRVHGGARRDFTATREAAVCDHSHETSTFDTIQRRIFDEKGCAVSTCHGVFGQGGLDLRDGASYGTLIGVPAANATALAAGKLRVAAGSAATSFLAQKLHGTMAAGEGSKMPLVGGALNATELALVDAWIDAGAPQVGNVPAAPCLPPLQYRPADPLPPPVGGYQIVLNGPMLQPGQEEEGCYWVRAPYPGAFTAAKWEFSLNPGTHHFAVYSNRIANPPVGTWLGNDFGCFQEADYGHSLSGAPQAPYYVDAYPAGMAKTLAGGGYLGLNAHYHNDFDVPIQMKVWINIYPYVGTPQHQLQTLTSLDTTFGVSVPPFTQVVRHGRFVNTLSVPMHFINLSGHMHKRGVRFTTWDSSGVKLYENFDWAHPLQVNYTTPLTLSPGDWFDYECLHDNGVTRPVKTIGGTPVTVSFGVTTDDEMCILPGSYYTD